MRLQNRFLCDWTTFLNFVAGTMLGLCPLFLGVSVSRADLITTGIALTVVEFITFYRTTRIVELVKIPAKALALVFMLVSIFSISSQWPSQQLDEPTPSPLGEASIMVCVGIAAMILQCRSLGGRRVVDCISSWNR